MKYINISNIRATTTLSILANTTLYGDTGKSPCRSGRSKVKTNHFGNGARARSRDFGDGNR
ncbi:hypothetical protein NHP194022_12810 [Helicobacter suis]|nr:hypothetical protein NHP194022_06180 [Helicobacter suis]BCD51610.1 hypothetical protein NHP194022_12810 [Helicobacter suis]